VCGFAIAFGSRAPAQTESASPPGTQPLSDQVGWTDDQNGNDAVSRFRLETPGGALSIHELATTREPIGDAEEHQTDGDGSDPDSPTPFVVFWLDTPSGLLYVYDVPLTRAYELGVALYALEEALGVATDELGSREPILAAALDAAGDGNDLGVGRWVPGTRDQVRATMGLSPSARPMNADDGTCDPTLCIHARSGFVVGDALTPVPVERVEPLTTPADAVRRTGERKPPGHNMRDDTDEAEQPVIQYACCGWQPGSCVGVYCSDSRPCKYSHCENGECVLTNRTDGLSCPDDDDVCTIDECQDGVCVHPSKCWRPGEICCSNGSCCAGVCCPDTAWCCESLDRCCGETCCLEGEICCNGTCAPCCDEDTGAPCPGTCCDPPGGLCCKSTVAAVSPRCCENDSVCCLNNCCDDMCCPHTDGDCCSWSPNGCCANGEKCCESASDGCCANGQTCCPGPEGGCCPAGWKCCNGVCDACCDPETGGPCGGTCCGGPPATCCNGNCCGDGTCCQEVCNECTNHGTLSGGPATASPAAGCVGEPITFTLQNAADSGGQERVNCRLQSIGQALHVTWVITRPDGTSYPATGIGSGTVATIPGTEVNTPGEYRATFTLTANRRCPPNPKVVTSDPAVAIVGDLDIDSDNSNGTGAPDRTTPEDDAEMTAPGKVICTNVDDDDADGSEDRNQEPPPAGDDDLVPMVAEILGGMSQGQARLQYDETKIQVYDTNRATIVTSGQYTSLPMTPNPKTFWVEGIAPTSGATTTCTFEIDHDSDGSPDCTDSVAMTVCDVQKVPLGGSVAAPCEAGCFRVYVPTKWGGVLNIQTTGGTITDLKYPDQTPYTNNTETGEDKHGWYTFRVTGAANYTVSVDFVQVGVATTIPWNGWYWPSLDSVNPNLYDQTGLYTPLADYDAVYGTTERVNELANYSGGSGWYGHCWGWSLAAIAMPQPAATTKNGITFNQDEMEGLYTELAEGATGFTYRVGSVDSQIPSGPPTGATGEPVDASPDDVHNGLRLYIRQQRQAMTVNLRKTSGVGDPEVWNHPVYRYDSIMEEAEGGNEKIIEITTTLTAALDFPSMPADGTTRMDTYVYVLEYTDFGAINGGSASQNWKSCSGFAPAWLATVETLDWGGAPWRHSGITKARVDGLY